MSPPFLILILSLLSFETTFSLYHGRPPPNYALDLNVANFDAVLRDTPATYAVVEFFAHWSPACRNYKPHYERVARLFNSHDAVHPGIILLARVDCGLKINTELCDKFSVDRHPMIFWGAASKFVSSGWKPRQEKSEIHAINDGRTADRLLNWINKKIGSSYTLDDEKFDNEHLASNMSDPGQIAQAVYDVEEATTIAFDVILAHKMIKSETRISLIRFLQLLVAHHPSRRCRKGSAEVLVNFDDSYPSDILSLNKEEIVTNGKSRLESSQICGKKVPRGNWMFCRGSKNETRGFSCGLWVLLHSLSVRIEDGESQFAFTAICDFIHNFFICEECRQHFYSMCSRVSSPFNTTRDFALWLWDAHNKVNERLLKEEASLGTGDPKIPKIIWPPKQLCSACYLPHSWRNNESSHIYWDRQEVFKFLTSYYGKMLISSNKERSLLGNCWTNGALDYLVVSTNAVVMLVGAALAVAILSRAFSSTRLLLAFAAEKSEAKEKLMHLRWSKDKTTHNRVGSGSE